MKKHCLFTKSLAAVLASAIGLGTINWLGSVKSAKAVEDIVVNSDSAKVIGNSADDSIVLDKNAYLTENGTYTIDLSAFVTGTAIETSIETTVRKKPVDVILVVDQSNSMDDSSGNYGHMSATKNAIKKFLNGLSDENLDHRVAIVGYSNGLDPENAAEGMYTNRTEYTSDDFPQYNNFRFRGTGVYDGANFYRYQEAGYVTTIEQGVVLDNKGNPYCYCNDAGIATDAHYKNALKNLNTDRVTIDASINALASYAGTHMSFGIKMAQKIVDSRTEKDRPAVVVLFTDGVPGNIGFSMRDAAESVNAANALKKNENVKIFTVALFADSVFDNQDSMASLGKAMFGLKPGGTSAAPIFTYGYEAPVNTRTFLDAVPRFQIANKMWSQHADSSAKYYPNEGLGWTETDWERMGYNVSFGGNLFKSANVEKADIEKNFLIRDLLTIISSDYQGVVADTFTMQEMWNKFGLGMAPVDNKSDVGNATLPDGYLWPVYNNGSENCYVNAILDIKKCIAYFKEGTNTLVAGDYWRAAYYGFGYTDGVKAHTKKYYMPTNGHSDTAAANETLLKEVFGMIQTEIGTNIITTGGAGSKILDGSAVLCDQLSGLFMIDNNVSVKAYRQAFAGMSADGKNYTFSAAKTEVPVKVQYDAVTGKIAVSGFNYSADENYVRMETDTPKGYRLLVVIEGVLAKENTVGKNIETNRESTSGMYPGKDHDSENNPPTDTTVESGTAGNGIIPKEPVGMDDEKPDTIGGELPATYNDTPLTFPVPKVNISAEYIVYDFSNSIEHAVNNGGAKIESFADPYKRIENKCTSITKRNAGISMSADSNKVNVDIMEISSNECALAMLLNMNKEISVDGEVKPLYEWKRICVIPATNVHYEERFVTFTDGIEGAQWHDAGMALTALQSDKNTLYGFDDSYGNTETPVFGDSYGTSKTVTVGKPQFGNLDNFPKATFTFTGTGFDIIGRSGFNTGVYVMKIIKDGKVIKGQIINTRYYGIGEGAEGETTLYQVPIISIGGLTYGTYTIETTLIWAPGYATRSTNGTAWLDGEEFEYIELFEAAKTKASEDNLPSFDVYFDAIRIYNPVAPDNEIANKAYKEADPVEKDPYYFEIRNYLINNSQNLALDSHGVSGMIAIDITPHKVPYEIANPPVQLLDSEGKPVFHGNGEPAMTQYVQQIGEDNKPVYDEHNRPVYKIELDENGKPVYKFVMPREGFTLEDYKNYGPNNEMYLKNGNAFAFEMDVEKLRTLQISAKVPSGTSMQLAVKVIDKAAISSKYAEKTEIISSATEMFYDFSNLIRHENLAGAKQVYVIIEASDMNESASGGILSLCKIKTVSTDDIKSGFTVNTDTLELLYAVTVGVKGDVNADASIDMKDALLTMRAALSVNELGTYGAYCADYNSDGGVDMLDVVSIARRVL